MNSKIFNLMGGDFEVILYEIDSNLAKYYFDLINSEANKLIKIFNFFDKTSELSKLNKKRCMKVSNELLTVVKKGIKLGQLSSGLIDISKGTEINLRKKGKEKKSTCTYNDIILNKNIITLKNGSKIDLGCIAKGYIVDKLIELLQSNGIENAFINARGDIRNYGSNYEVVEVLHPRDNTTLCPLVLKNKSIATSGDYRQFTNTYQNSHILNQKDLISVTVVANSLLEADGLATSIFTMGLKNSKKFLKQSNHPTFIIDNNLNQYMFNGFDKLLVNI